MSLTLYLIRIAKTSCPLLPLDFGSESHIMYFPMFPKVAAPKIIYAFLDILITVEYSGIEDEYGYKSQMWGKRLVDQRISLVTRKLGYSMLRRKST